MAAILPRKPTRKRLATAITLASGAISSLQVSAGTYIAELSGAINFRSTWICGVPGIFYPYPPTYQHPRLVPYGGPGWKTELTLSIDSNTGEITHFKEQVSEGFLQGGGSRSHIYPKGVFWESGKAFPMPQCGVISPNPGETGTIVYTCPVDTCLIDALPDSSELIDFNASGFQCITPYPSSTNFTAANGCGQHNSGVTFPGGIPNLQTREVTNGAHIAVPENSGFAYNGASNPAFYATNDPEQYFNGVSVESLSKKAPSTEFNTEAEEGVDFTIKHTGTFSGGDFSVTHVVFLNKEHFWFQVGGGALPPGTADIVNRSEYNTVINQTFTASEDDLGKPVPAMGAFGLSALFMGLMGLAGRLISRTV